MNKQQEGEKVAREGMSEQQEGEKVAREGRKRKGGWEFGFLLCVPNSGVFLGMFLRIPEYLGQQD